MRGEKVNRMKNFKIEKHYKVNRKSFHHVVIEELKGTLKAKIHKMKIFTQSIEQYRVNKLFDQNQNKVYHELNGKKNNENSVPDANESKIFCQTWY